MKKLILLISIIGILTGCADDKYINGNKYRPYGLFNYQTCANDSVKYTVCGWALASGIIFSETIIVPIYVFGFNIMEADSWKSDSGKLNGIVGNPKEVSIKPYQIK